MFIENTEELAQNKLLLLYIIEKSKDDLTNQNITEIILEKNYMNYFLVQQYLSELISTKFIELVDSNDKKIYKLLDKGKVTLSYFEDRIEDKVKKELSGSLGISEEVEVKKEIIGEYFKQADYEYVVNLKLKEGEATLFSLYLNLANEKQAKEICENWESNPEYIYKNILNLVVGEDII